MFKRILSAAVFFSILALLLCGCAAGLPQGYDAAAVEQRAHEIVGDLSARNFEAIEAATREDIRPLLSAGVLEDSVGALIADLGAFKAVDSISLTSTKDETGEEYAVAVVTASYENGKAVYTISFDRDLMLVGLYMR